MRVIKDNEVVDDNWQWLQAPDDTGIPEGDVIIPFTYWQEHRNELIGKKSHWGICINGDDETDDVAKDLAYFDLIAVEFPAFKDGRGYSHARTLRDHYAYKGDIRAVGDVLRDQLYYLQRCGVSSFLIREDKSIEDAIKGLSDFSVKYQTAADGASPVYTKR